MKPPEPPFIDPGLFRLPIASVERETGVGKETLRVWERRYGFPRPERDAAGEPAYSAAEVEKLRLVKRLIDAGHRPGTVVALPLDALGALCDRLRASPDSAPDVERCLELLKANALEALRQRLLHVQRHEGLARFVTDLVAPLGTRVGDAWMRGDLPIFAEHAYAELAENALRQALSAEPMPAGAAPRVLLSTFPGEPHRLGLLMAEALLRLAGAEGISLGVQTPVWDLACAAVAYRCDIVAIGFSGSISPNHVVAGLTELRAKLPASVALWAGGAAPVLHRRRIAGVKPIAALAGIGDAVHRWRAVPADRRGESDPARTA